MGGQKVGGACMSAVNKFPVKASVKFTDEDVAALNEAYFEGEHISRMSNVPGVICWQDMTPIVNRDYADLVSENCEDVLKGEGAKEKCDALYRIIDFYSYRPSFWTLEGFKYYAVEVVIGAIGTGLLIGLGFAISHKVIDRLWPSRADRKAARRAEKKDNKKSPPDDTPPSGTGGVAEAKKAPAAQVKASFGFGQLMQRIDPAQQVASAKQSAPIGLAKMFQQPFRWYSQMAQAESLTHVATLDALRGKVPSPTQMGYADMPDPEKIYEYVIDSSASGYMNPDRVPIIGVCSTTGLPVGVAEPVVVRPPVWEPVPARLPIGLRIP